MDYEEFIACLVAGLRELYGKDVLIERENMLKNNGYRYHGLRIALETSRNIIPVISTDGLYEEYREGKRDIDGCIRELYRMREQYECTDAIMEFADGIKDWEKVKEKVYPVLLSTEENRELLQRLVSMPLLDLSIIYIIRGDRKTSVKISRSLLEDYGISREELHRKAVENLEKDGYRFQDMEDLITEMLQETGICGDILPQEGFEHGKMYVLTNSEKLYGAAGILDKKLVKEFAGDRDFYILPSSLHETIFVPADSEIGRQELDNMVAEINKTVVDREERLTSHSYYYDAREDEIRMCA